MLEYEKLLDFEGWADSRFENGGGFWDAMELECEQLIMEMVELKKINNSLGW